MNIRFTKEPDGIYCAIAEKEVYKGVVCEELLFAEITPTPGGFEVRWEDDYGNPSSHKTLDDAKQYIILEQHKHSPHINGKTWTVDE
ncbi:MAG TPA: hypothetical protein VD927_06320 [Chryseosolibacter sp.]|nr:hypothetical protein [Chryseosolibacter sp.]